MIETPLHLLDVNVVVALLDDTHIHYETVQKWIHTPRVRWAMCAFTEAGVLRFFTRQRTVGGRLEQVTAMLERLELEPGYHYQPITSTWKTLTKPFAQRMHGHNQVTDAYLLGLAIREVLVLTTFDKAILHLAGEHRNHMLLLEKS